MLIFIILLVAPSINAIKFIVLLPAKQLLTPSATLYQIALWWGLYQLISVFWVELSFRQIYRKPWSVYLSSLPIKSKVFTLTEIFNLFFANIIILIPLFFTFIDTLATGHLLTSLVQLEKILLLVGTMLIIQYTWLNSKKIFVITLLLTNLLVLLSFSIDSIISQQVVITIVITSMIFSFYYFDLVGVNYKKVSVKGQYFYEQPSFKFVMSPLIKIQVINHKTAIQYRKIILIVLSCIYTIIMFNFSNLSLLLFIAAFIMLANSFVLSGLYSKFDDGRHKYSHSLKALPFKYFSWLKADYLILSKILICFNLFYLLVCSENFMWQSMLALGLSHIYLLIMYFPQVKFKKNGSLISLILMPVFVYINYLSIYSP